MTRKDFELIAEVLDLFFERTSQDEIDLATFEMLANDFAIALAETNPAFDRDRFLEAAGAA